jgi:uroporphyrin-III C-methyltransferase/precorrin-2 dehydrogenase/sirohydrochlorin ferrochelatase
MSVSPPSDRAVPPPFPVFLDLAGHPVLVVGDGAEAAAKCRLLMRSSAVVRLVAADPDSALREMIAAGQVHPAGADLTAAMLAGARLCVVALDDDAAAAAAVALARACGVLVNAVDRPELCDCIVPAIVDRAPVTVAIATGGVAPALARSLRGRIEQAIPPGVGALARLCRDWRARVAAALPERTARRRFWDAVVAGAEAMAALDGRMADAETALRARLQAARGAPAGPLPGRASLVGAGPGDPELLTLRAVRALQSADVILYDALIDPAVLDYARRDARRIDVGKRCGRPAPQQTAINRLILEHARKGAYVVRLKGGDPFVFGRGGEELEALRAAGIAVDIIPGVTAACAAAAGLGLPLTHRGMARSLHFITGHGADGHLPEQDWPALVAAGGTVAAYMGLRTLPELAARLIGAGLSAATPAAAVENASRRDERRVFATLAGLADALADAAITGPTLVLIGAVVALAETGEPARLVA